MIIIDIIFKIALAPLVKYDEKGRLIAIFWISPALALLLASVINLVCYWIRPVIEIHFTPLINGVIVSVLVILLIRQFQNIYVSNNRETGKDYHPLVGLLIPALYFGSLVLFVMSLKYG